MQMFILSVATGGGSGDGFRGVHNYVTRLALDREEWPWIPLSARGGKRGPAPEASEPEPVDWAKMSKSGCGGRRRKERGAGSGWQ